MEILLQIIEEEVNVGFNQLTEQFDDYGDYGDYGGGGGGGDRGGSPLGRDKFIGTLLSPVTDIWNAVKFRAGEIGIKGVKTVSQLIVNTITTILPFYDPAEAEKLDEKLEGWQSDALQYLDRQFAKERKELDEGWETFKTDFWNIGFVASPMNAIAALAVGGKTLDAAFSVLNVASGFRAERVFDLLTGESGRSRRGYRYEAVEPETAKTKFKDLPENEKKKVFDELMKNPEIVKAVQKWSTENLPKVMGSVVKDMNAFIASGQAGNITPQEIASYKAMAPNFVTTMFDKMKGKNKKFEVKPSKEALAAANQVVASEIKSMPDVVTKPQQSDSQAPKTSTQPQPVAAQPKQ